MSGPTQHAYIAQGIELGIRSDGRGCLDCRPLELELGLIAQANGSARLHLGRTDVIVGVKLELSSPDPYTPDCGKLQVTVECSSVASPAYEGRGGESWGTELARALQTILAGVPGKTTGIDLQQLSIIKGKACWAVYVDALVLNDDGNVLDALSYAAKAALAATRYPRVTCTAGDGSDSEAEVELDDDVGAFEPLDAARVPVITTVSQVGNRCVVDLSAEEEPCCSAALHIAVTSMRQVCGITKAGSHGVDPSLVQEMVEVAQKVAPPIIQALDQHVAVAAAAGAAGS